MFKKLFTSLGWSKNQQSLIFFNTFIGLVFIFCTHTTLFFPLSSLNFFFFSFLGLLFALYRPAWTFLLLVGMLPYEIIDLSPIEYQYFSLRPYQWIFIFLSLALVIRYFMRRFPLEKLILSRFDWAMIVFVLSAFLSALMSDQRGESLKLSVILFSFVCIYFMGRLFIRTREDSVMLFPFIFSSFFIVSFYSLIQNIFFLSGITSYEIMPGRPNAFFSEPDWLGGYVASILIFLSTLLVFLESVFHKNLSVYIRFLLSSILFVGAIALFLSVSRSAWLATFFGLGVLVILFLKQHTFFQKIRERDYRTLIELSKIWLWVSLPFVGALCIVSFFHLSLFDLFDRSRSTATGEQEITVACVREVSLPKKIESIEELASYDCTHIRLEEIASRKDAGEYVTTLFRNDPNVHIRASIYNQVFKIIKEHPYFGIGFGTVSSFLGMDERGTGLNASNLFLEIWLGSGILGFCAFLFLWFAPIWKILTTHFDQISPILLVLLPIWTGLTIFNIFNSGLMLGFFFFFLIFFSLSEISYKK